MRCRGECDHDGMPSKLPRTTVVLVAFVILAIAPFAYAATRSWFWQHQHSMAPVATALYLLVLGAFVLGRYRWAWALLAVLYGIAIVTWGFDSDRFVPRNVLGFVVGVATFALLVSSPMRDRLRRPVGIGVRGQRASHG
jgi:lysylphosphatidylglycerol synthetase-like protein (DUF2156 family)